MRTFQFSPTWLAVLFFAGVLPAVAQLPDSQSDPLARIREAAKTNVEACSATGERLCEQVAPKIIANAQGDSPLAENLHKMADGIAATKAHNPGDIVSWAVSAFRDAGVDVQTEKYANPEGSSPDQENVVAEFRGRQKPEEWVLVGAHLYTGTQGPPTVNDYCGAAMVIEAARDIISTGIHPRRSIRFVLFTGNEDVMPGPWAYVRSHRVELDRARASITLDLGCYKIAGYSLSGRHEIEPGVREAMKPAGSLGTRAFFDDGGPGTDGLDFFLEGVPTLGAIQATVGRLIKSSPNASAFEKLDIAELKRNSGFVAVTAFGIAEHAEPLGRRRSRTEIEASLKSMGFSEWMKKTGIWPLWESGQRGRLH